jgi:hypothetical protein
MISVELEKGVPLPVARQKYPYKEMEVGDSFFVFAGGIQNVCNQNYRMGKKLGMSFIARKEGDGVRVWRTA